MAFSSKLFEKNHPHVHSLETANILVCDIVKPFEKAAELKSAVLDL